MSTISLRLPDSIHQGVKEMAKKDHVSINQFVNSAVAEKLSALMTEEYLTARAQNAPSQKEFNQLLHKVPNVAPDKGDER